MSEQFALLKSDGGKVRVTVLEPYCNLNWRVRVEESCRINGSTFEAGRTYIAGKSQITFHSAGTAPTIDTKEA